MEKRFHNMISVSGCAVVIPESSIAACMEPPKDQTMRRTVLQIRHAIQVLPGYGVFDILRFGIAPDGEVLLEGEVSKAQLKPAAERIVQTVESVKSVINEVRVLPSSDRDTQLRHLLYINLYGHPELETYDPHLGKHLPADADFGADWFALTENVVVPGGVPGAEPPGAHPIHIIVERGKVLLVGLVDTSADKTLAAGRAECVAGTRTVKNNLLVKVDLPRGSCCLS